MQTQKKQKNKKHKKIKDKNSIRNFHKISHKHTKKIEKIIRYKNMKTKHMHLQNKNPNNNKSIYYY
jgi:hypothetical protein